MSGEIQPSVSSTEANIVSNADKQEIRRKIREQIEFYFSDANLSKDRFLRQEILNAQDSCEFSAFVY
jgi:hypothetical protein